MLITDAPSRAKAHVQEPGDDPRSTTWSVFFGQSPRMVHAPKVLNKRG